LSGERLRRVGYGQLRRAVADQELTIVTLTRASAGRRQTDVYTVGQLLQKSAYVWLAALLGTVLQEDAPGCHAGREEGRRLLQRAQKAGAVRKDVSFGDLVCMVTAISLAIEQGGSSKSRVAHLVDLFLDGIGNTQMA